MSTEFEYFQSREMSVLVDLVLKLTAELSVSRRRIAVLELELTRRGCLEAGAVDNFRPDEDQASRLAADGEGLLNGLVDIMTESAALEQPLRQQWQDQLKNQKVQTG